MLEVRKEKAYQDLCDRIDSVIILYEIELVFPILIEAIKWYNSVKNK